MNFLPDDYELPLESGDYMKWVNGPNTFRMLSKPIFGYEWWTADKQPMRSIKEPTFEQTKGQKVCYFWAMIVWNYQARKIQILQIRQKTILRALDAYRKNPKWGSPTNYDICVTKEQKAGNSLLTKYVVSAEPHSPITEEMKAAFMAKPCNLEALFDGGQPFSPDNKIRTAPVFETVSGGSNAISREEAFELMSMFLECSPEFRANVKKFCATQGVREDFTNCKPDMAEKMKRSFQKNIDECKAALHPIGMEA